MRNTTHAKQLCVGMLPEYSFDTLLLKFKSFTITITTVTYQNKNLHKKIFSGLCIKARSAHVGEVGGHTSDLSAAPGSWLMQNITR